MKKIQAPIALGGFSLLLLCACAPTSSDSLTAVSDNPGIINGSPVDANKNSLAPIVITSMTLTEHDQTGELGQCTGTLIGDRVVLTAAHCVDATAGQKLVVLDLETGKSNSEDPNKATPAILVLSNGAGNAMVESIAIADDYSSESQKIKGDIALMKLAKPLDLTKAAASAPIKAKLDAKGLATPGSQVFVMGYGISKISSGFLGIGGGKKKQTGLNQKSFVVVDRQSIQSNVPVDAAAIYYDVPTNGQPGGQCQGDSGGPLFAISGNEVVLTGVVSRVEGAKKNVEKCKGLNVATSVSAYLPWIKKQAKSWGLKLY